MNDNLETYLAGFMQCDTGGYSLCSWESRVLREVE